VQEQQQPPEILPLEQWTGVFQAVDTAMAECVPMLFLQQGAVYSLAPGCCGCTHKLLSSGAHAWPMPLRCCIWCPCGEPLYAC
jgi:hypothetical protein